MVEGREGTGGGGASLNMIQSTAVLWHTATCCGIHVHPVYMEYKSRGRDGSVV